MTFAVGGVDVAAVSVGATPAQAVYLGSVKVWPAAPPPAYRWTREPGEGPATPVGTWLIRQGRIHISYTDADGNPQPLQFGTHTYRVQATGIDETADIELVGNSANHQYRLAHPSPTMLNALSQLADGADLLITPI